MRSFPSHYTDHGCDPCGRAAVAAAGATLDFAWTENLASTYRPSGLPPEPRLRAQIRSAHPASGPAAGPYVVVVTCPAGLLRSRTTREIS